MAEGYVARLPTTFVPQRAPRIGGTGAAIAAGVEQLAGTVGDEHRRDQHQAIQLQEQEARRQRSRATVENMARLTELQLSLEQELEAKRNAAPPGAAGYDIEAEALVRQRLKDFEDSLPPDEQLRQNFLPQIDRMMAGAVSGERVWAARQWAAYSKDTVEKFTATRLNGLMAKPTGEGYTAFIEDTRAFVDGMGLDQTTAAAFMDDAHQRGAYAMLDGLILAGRLEAAKALLDSGQLDGVLGDAKKTYLQRVAAGVQQQQVQARQIENERQRAAEEALKVMALRIEREDVPASELNAALAEAKAAGVADSVLLKHAYLAEDAGLAAAVRGQTSAALDARSAALATKRSAGTMTRAEQAEADFIDKERDARDTKKAESISALVRSGPQGVTEAVMQMRGMTVEEQERVAYKAGRRDLALLARTPNEMVVGWAIKGRELRTDRADDFKPAKTPRATGDEQVDAIMREVLGETIDAAGGSYKELRELALDTMAGADGKWNPAGFRRSIQLLSGQTQRRDGTWQGGIGEVRGRKIELPLKWSADEFDRRMSRMTFANAQYRNGRPAVKADVLKNYRVVFHGNDEAGNYLYRFEDAKGHPLQAASGPVFVMSMPERP